MIEESVSGLVIGDVSALYCRLYYNGKPQRNGFCVDSSDHAMLCAKKVKDQIKSELGDAFRLVYANDSLWEARIYGDFRR